MTLASFHQTAEISMQTRANVLAFIVLVAGTKLSVASQPATAQPNTDAPAAPAAAQPVDETALHPRILKPILHPKFGLKTFEVRPEETESYYYILARARDTDLKTLKAAARVHLDERLKVEKFRRYRENPDREFPMFVDLFANAKNPEIHHGKLVTLTGHLRRLLAMPAGKNDHGIDTLYEAWLYTDDSQQHPAVVVCTSVPDGMLDAFNARELLDHVSVTGYFFKMFGYDAKDARRFAPMILGKRLEWHRPAPPAPPLVPESVIYVTIVVVLTIGVGTLWIVARKDRQVRESRLQAGSNADAKLEFDPAHLGESLESFEFPNSDATAAPPTQSSPIESPDTVDGNERAGGAS